MLDKIRFFYLFISKHYRAKNGPIFNFVEFFYMFHNI